MTKLLSANFSRLKKDKVFWIAIVGTLGWSIFNMLNDCRRAIANASSGYEYQLDDFYFTLIPFMGLLCAVFTSLFLGTEYSDGTIRNKIVVGHSRLYLYLSNWIVSFSATIFMLVAFLVGGLVGIPTLGVWKMGAASLAIHLLITVLIVAVFSSIFTCISMLSSNKAITAVISILLFLGLLVCGSMIYNALSQPELSSGVQITAEGLQMMEPTPNPDYISGTTRKIYEFFLELLPTGQSIMVADLAVANPIRMIVLSILLTAGITAGGIYAFRRKDLK